MVDTRSGSINIQVDPDLMASCGPILSAIGLSFSDVVNLMLHQISLKRRIPFDLSSVQLTENGYTPEFEAAILAEAEEVYKAIENGTAKLYGSAEELFADLDSEEDDV